MRRGLIDDERVALSRARADVARGRYDEAIERLQALAQSRDPAVVLRAKIQLALVSHAREDPEEAVQLLLEATDLVAAQRARGRERSEVEAVRADAAPSQLDPAVRMHREGQLELARVWTRIDRPAEARKAYRTLLREADINEARTSEARYIAALAEYRLAELLVDTVPLEACDHWRRVLDTGDPKLSPYAALRMATQIGSKYLVTARVERLFHHAMGAGDPQLAAEATLGLARHLEDKHQYAEARRYFEKVTGDAVAEEQAAEGLRFLKEEITIAPAVEKLERPRYLRAKLQDEYARIRAKDKRVIIVGAGTGGSYLLESLDPERYTICGFVDDHARDVPGYPRHRILGRIDDLVGVIKRNEPDEVLLAIPTLAGHRRRAVVEACRDTSTPLSILPRMHELGIGWTLNENRRLMTQLRPVEIEDLLGERRVEIDALATSWLQYATVLVVGAGALGAEICRRLADGDVGRLVVLDSRESALEKVVDDLADTREFWGVVPLVREATDSRCLADAFREYRPKVVFNTTGRSSALALDPKGLLRDPRGWETIVRKEVFTATAVARAAAERGVPLTVHVSSRRAGAPRDPFGAMKALSEEVALLHAATYPNTTQAVVRIGPLQDSGTGPLTRLMQQIRAGATVTIPGPHASVRYLSTARWAELVLHAARLASNGELLEPDAGDLVKVRDIAEEAIRLRGWYPDEDIFIEERGDDRWDEPPSSASSRWAKDEELGIFALWRHESSLDSLERAIVNCAETIEEYRGDRPGISEPAIWDAIQEIAASWPEEELEDARPLEGSAYRLDFDSDVFGYVGQDFSQVGLRHPEGQRDVEGQDAE